MKAGDKVVVRQWREMVEENKIGPMGCIYFSDGSVMIPKAAPICGKEFIIKEIYSRVAEMTTGEMIPTQALKKKVFMNEKEVLKKLIIQSGCEAQCRIAMEECAELIQAISKMMRYGEQSQLDNLTEEIADVQIMIEQLKILFGVEEDRIRDYRMEKVEVLKKLINL